MLIVSIRFPVLSPLLSSYQTGLIYLEARSTNQVQQTFYGLVSVYPSCGFQHVPIKEMPSFLQIKKQDLTVTPGSWVCIRAEKYTGDLAQVMDIGKTGDDFGIQSVPRIDLTPRDESSLDGAKKQKKQITNATMPPPQQLLKFEEVTNLSIIAAPSRKAAIVVLQPGDHVEVFEGEQAGVHGVVDLISPDVVTIIAVGIDIDGQKAVLPARSVRKRFKPGDPVKVMTGRNADETGLVVSVADNIVTFLSDMSMQEVSHTWNPDY